MPAKKENVIINWTHSHEWESRADVARSCICPNRWGDESTVLQYKLTAGALVVLAEHAVGDFKGHIFVTIFLLSKDDGVWGYKSIDDNSIPFHCDVPLSYIDKTIASGREVDKSLHDWHSNVRKYHKENVFKKTMASKATKGTCVKYCGVVYELVKQISGRLGWEVISKSDKQKYRLMSKQLRDSEIYVP